MSDNSPYPRCGGQQGYSRIRLYLKGVNAMRFQIRHRFMPGLLLLLLAASAPAQSTSAAPRIWNDRDLAEWATPIAALNIRPGHMSEKEFYSVPVAEWVRTYPVYFPGREPDG